MRSSSIARTLAAVLGTTAACAVSFAGPASAHGAPFTVTAGSAPAGSTIAVTKTSGTLTFKDTTTGVTVTCASVVIKGSLPVGSSNGTPLVTLDGSSIQTNSCTGPAGLKFAATGFGSWNINISDSTNGVSTGTVTNFRIHVVSTAGPTCAFDLGSSSGTFTSAGTSSVDPGSFPGNYSNSTRAIGVPATNPGALGIWNMNPGSANHYCVSKSVAAQGDRVSFSASFALSADNSAYNPIAVN